MNTRRVPRDHDRLLRTFGRLVPGSRRAEWLLEWRAEVAHAAGRAARDRGAHRRIARRVWLALPDAIWLRLHPDRPISPQWRLDAGPGPASALEHLIRDTRVAARSLRKQPGFFLVATLTIGLGVGAATTIFSLVDGILLKPLGYAEPERLVAVWPDEWYSGWEFDLLQAEATSYVALAAWGPRSFTEVDDEGAYRVWGSRATTDFLAVLGAPVAAGRPFGASEAEPGSPGGAVLSHDFWMRRFRGDLSVIGRGLRISGGDVGEGDVPILGVMPPGFDFRPGSFSEVTEPADIAITVPFDPDHIRYRSSEYKVIGRLRDGVTIEQATDELRGLVNGWKERFGESDDYGRNVSVVELKTFMTGSVRPTVLLLFGSVGLILLIAAVNVTNLLLARGLTRRREVAMRLALGASRGRVVRQLLAESTVLGLAGAVTGLLIAVIGVRALRSLLPPGTPRLADVAVDWRVLAFCVVIAFVTAWAIGLLPAVRSSGADVRSAFGARGGIGGSRRRRLHTGLLTAEIGLAVMLLASAGLLTKSFWRLTRVDPGFQAQGLARLYVRPSPDRVETMGDFVQYFRLIDERIEAVPGVIGAATVTQSPVTGDGGVVGYAAVDRPPSASQEPPAVRWRAVSHDYFAVASIPLLEGRVFTPSDVDGGEQVALLSRQAAEELFRGESALGKRVVSGFEPRQPATVVGVVGDVRILGPAEASLPMMYRPYEQIGAVVESFGFAGREVIVRTGPGGTGSATAIRDAVREIDRFALVTAYETLPSALADTLAERRTTWTLLSSFAFGALILGAIGIYGVTGYVVRSRRREMGVRLAVGASAGRVVREVLSGVLKIGALGAGFGILASLALAGVLRRFLVDVAPVDFGVLGLAVATVLAVAVLAAVLPALSAGRVDPIGVLSGD